MMKESIYKPTRYPKDLAQRIDQARGSTTFSRWIKEAAAMRLEDERGLTPDYEGQLRELNRQIIAIGRNLNQLARAANSGLPVHMDMGEARALGQLLRDVRDQLIDVQGRLP